MEIDARVHPEAETVEIGDRRNDRLANPVAAAQLAEHASHRRMGRDDDVRIDPLDHSKQRARAEGDERHLADAAAKGRAREEPVQEPVNARRVSELPAVEVAENEAQDAPAALQRVYEHDLELAALVLELGDNRARSRDVALAHRSGKNKHAPVAGVALPCDAPRRT